MRHVKGIGFCRDCKIEQTHLVLSPRAEKVFMAMPDVIIYEKELVDTEGAPEYRYYIRGKFDVDDVNVFYLNGFLEALADFM